MLAFCRTTGRAEPRRGRRGVALTECHFAGRASRGRFFSCAPVNSPRVGDGGLIDRVGVVVVADVTRESFSAALERVDRRRWAEADVKFDPPALAPSAAPRHRPRSGRQVLQRGPRSAHRCVRGGAAGHAGRSRRPRDRGDDQPRGGQRRRRRALRVRLALHRGQVRRSGGEAGRDSSLRRVATTPRPRSTSSTAASSFRWRTRSANDRHSLIRAPGRPTFARQCPHNRFKDTLAEPLGDYMKAGSGPATPPPFSAAEVVRRAPGG